MYPTPSFFERKKKKVTFAPKLAENRDFGKRRKES